MDAFVGTSGWAYPWNETKKLDWFISNTGLNSIELNASFYRYPSPDTVKKWAQKATQLRWAIKANRLFTHTYKFNKASLEKWESFCKLFSPMQSVLDFYLFQLPPNTTPNSAPAIEAFAEKIGIGNRFALEVRNSEWFRKEWTTWAEKLGITLVSVDAPDLPRDIFCLDGVVYLRMHGRTAWYSQRYSAKELQEVAVNIRKAKPKKAYVFFNNDTAMLENAQTMLQLLKS